MNTYLSNKFKFSNVNLTLSIFFSLFGLFLFSQTTVNFNYTGTTQTWVVPPCVTSISITAAGGDGGGSAGGNGAVVTGTVNVTPGQTLQISVGGSGSTGAGSGGFGGGGTGRGANSGANASGGGGGATSISVSPFALANRIVVAGGGGGMGGGTTDAAGGAGGCGTGTTGVASFGGGGTGGTQFSGGTGGNPWGSGNNGASGSLGIGAAGATDNCNNNSPGGGGGGGYYGGGSGGADCYAIAPYGGGGGGGGSSLVPAAGGGCSPGTNNGPGYLIITYTTSAVAGTATNTGPYCVGSTVQLNGTGGGTYAWTGPNGFTSSIQNPTIPSATMAAAGVYNLTATNAGCVSTASTTVVMNALPIVNAGAAQTICAGTSVTLAATGATTYSWNNGVTQNVAFTPLATTTYTVTGTTAGCTSTSTVSITVNPIPPVNAGAPQTICIGFPVTLSASGATTYSWDNGVTQDIPFYPLSTNTYTVTGTSLGCTNTSNVTVTVNPLPTVDAGSDITICDGGSVTLNGNGANTYTWSNGEVNGVSFVPTIGAGSITVSGTDVNGCINSDQLSLTVNPNPTPLIIGPGSYCSGAIATLAADQVYTTYLWNNGSTNSSIDVVESDGPSTLSVTNSFGCQGTSPAFSVVENPVIVYNSSIAICQGQSATIHGLTQTLAGTYSQSFTAANGCDSLSNVTLTLNSLPIINAGTDVTVCQGSSVTLNANGANTYSWDNSVINNVAFTPNVGSTVYTVTGTNLNGCVNSDNLIVLVNPTPSVNAGNDVSICIGNSVILNGAGANSYSWDNGVTDGISFIPSTPGITTYTVTGTSTSGCLDSDQIIVTVNALPNVNAGNDQVICEGNSVVLTGSGAATYSWSGGVNNGVQFVPTLGSTNFTVVGTSAAGCTASDQVNIVVNPNPIVTFTSDLTTGCAPLSVNLANTTLNSSNCTWTLSNGLTFTNCGSVPVTFSQAGCYDVALTTTNLNGCTSSLAIPSFICVQAQPNAEFIASPNPVTTDNTLVNFTNESSGADSYSWNFGDDTALSTQTDPFHVFPDNSEANYMVTLIASTTFGCIDSAMAIIEVQEGLLYYIPNTFTPDGDLFNQTFKPIFTSGFDPFDYTLLIYNRWGEIVFESRNPEIGWDGTYGGNSEIGLCQEGVFTWKIEFKTIRNDERKMIVGHVNLLR
jgi:gliding motility-associated-like protein